MERCTAETREAVERIHRKVAQVAEMKLAIENENQQRAIRDAQIKSELEQAYGQRDAFKHQVVQIQQERDDLNHQVVQIEQEREDLNHQVVQIEQERDDLNHQVVQIQQERDGLNHQRDALRAGLSQAYRKREHIVLDLNQRLSAMHNGLSLAHQARERVELDLNRQCDALSQQCDALRTELSQANQKRERVELDLNQQCDALNQRSDALRTELLQANQDRERAELDFNQRSDALRAEMLQANQEQERAELDLKRREDRLELEVSNSQQQVEERFDDLRIALSLARSRYNNMLKNIQKESETIQRAWRTVSDAQEYINRQIRELPSPSPPRPTPPAPPLCPMDTPVESHTEEQTNVMESYSRDGEASVGPSMGSQDLLSSHSAHTPMDVELCLREKRNADSFETGRPGKRRRHIQDIVLPFQCVTYSSRDILGRPILVSVAEAAPGMLQSIEQVADEWLIAYTRRSKKKELAQTPRIMIDALIQTETESCFSKQVGNQGRSTWTKEHTYEYACLTCANKQKMCFKKVQDRLCLLPLPPDADQYGRYIAESGNLFKKSHPLRHLWA